ncbi:substrate-binding domain-containing protein [Catellatospora tritici]|uniref:substrate-binding domain-containing protein n=1 Tax=Catellatospora tritici TaxID=2851566 RepID=UPI001C2CDB43|nr:substrate-binding domain-containing protein [Catellatospora tritici]MBV1855205.1 substrate-binding domain-containing protein [Catellatospora tritici]
MSRGWPASPSRPSPGCSTAIRQCARRPAASGPPDWAEARDRAEGWRDALRAAGRPIPPVITGDWSPRSGYRAGQLIAERPDATAVFCANDQQALGLLRALRERGLRVPEDVSVVGFDDIPEARYLSPPLTTVRQDFDEVGRLCLRALLDMFDDPSLPAGHLRVRPDLAVRASSGHWSPGRRHGHGDGPANGQPVTVALRA